MKGPKWWLYGEDLELARDLQHKAIAASKGRDEQLANISILSYLGDYQGCSDWLDRVNGYADVIGRQSDYRIRRYRRIPNPWSALLEPSREEPLAETISKRLKTKQQIVVDLVGGIGDQLENAALLLSIQSQMPSKEIIAVRPLGEHSGVVKQLLLQNQGLQIHNENNPGQLWRITAPWFRYWLGRSGISEIIQQPLVIDIAEPASQGKLLVCWRSKPDPTNPLSSFSRSLSFDTILDLLELWQPAASKKGLRLIDISDYSFAESQRIRELHSWVDLARNRINSLEDTRQLMRGAAAIATVDTSLGHLAVLCARPVQLLLPLWPDERWYDLLDGGLYGALVTTYRQRQFNSWREPLKDLSQRLHLPD
ncbi:hypothetical protein KBY58_06800 [Cyanobium sp. HWJ4-Hawea]|uniref:hypothetical protein n=1 Tax=Cyanobium sp. HWJ4-Hawea TaxID=2823713 RepID=UPI0020CC67D0|nr:hypothetical protein [Cyanobium sp. HWJ4-Hawea]MCP9809139.1 hypothetical protein [Cyanobium sp. HWJ4-Hawea]